MLSLSTSYTLAEVTECLNNELCAIAVDKNQSAPFSGQLLSTKLAIQISQKADYCEKYSEIEMQRLKDEYAIKAVYTEKRHALDIEIKDKRIEMLENNYKWYKRPAFVAAITTISVSLAIFGSVRIYRAVYFGR